MSENPGANDDPFQPQLEHQCREPFHRRYLAFLTRTCSLLFGEQPCSPDCRTNGPHFPKRRSHAFSTFFAPSPQSLRPKTSPGMLERGGKLMSGKPMPPTTESSLSDTLTPIQIRVLQCLVAGQSVTAAAKEAGLHRTPFELQLRAISGPAPIPTCPRPARPSPDWWTNLAI